MKFQWTKVIGRRYKHKRVDCTSHLLTCPCKEEDGEIKFTIFSILDG